MRRIYSSVRLARSLMPVSVSCSTMSGSASSHTVVSAAQNKSKIRIHCTSRSTAQSGGSTPLAVYSVCLFHKTTNLSGFRGVPGTPASHKNLQLYSTTAFAPLQGKKPSFQAEKRGRSAHPWAVDDLVARDRLREHRRQHIDGNGRENRDDDGDLLLTKNVSPI